MGLNLFCLGVVILGFEVVSAPVLSFILGSGYVLMTVSIAFLAQGAGAILVSLFARRLAGRITPGLIVVLSSALGLAVAASFVGVASIQNLLNAVVERAQPGYIQVDWTNARQKLAPLLGCAIAVPHLVFAVAMNLIYIGSAERNFRKNYLFELCGGTLGCVLAVVLLDKFSFHWSLVALTALAFLPALFLLWNQRGSRLIAGSCLSLGALILFAIGLMPGRFEPEANGDLLARNWGKNATVRELFHSWNANTRFGLLQIQTLPSDVRYVVALGSGEGHATVPLAHTTDKENVGMNFIGRVTSVSGFPENVLILCSGVGADFARIASASVKKSELVGVELNRQMVEALQGMPLFDLPKVMRDANAKLIISDARIHLAGDPAKYSVIILSYQGSSSAQFLTSFGATTQYLYTEEALRLMLSHLKPGGMLVIYNSNKFNLLHGLRHLAAEGFSADPAKAAIVLDNPYKPENDWNLAADSNPLLIKPAGFTSEEVAKIEDAALREKLAIAYAPGRETPRKFRQYLNILIAANPDDYVWMTSVKEGMRFGISTDDNPFPLNQLRLIDYFSPEFLESIRSKVAAAEFGFTAEEYELLALLVVMAISLLLVLGGLAARSGPAAQFFRSGSYFFAVGIAFIFLEIGCFHRMILLVGSPTLALAVTIGGILLFSGIGALASEATLVRGALTLPRAALLLSVYLFGVQFLRLPIQDFAVQLPLFSRILFVLSVLAPAAFLQGHFFPRGVFGFQYRPATLLWGRALNVIGNTFGVTLAVIFAKTLGITALSACGLAAYLIAALILPRDRLRQS